jgi:hypothetical protein
MPFRSSEDRVGLLAIETTYGVAATIAAANALLLMNSSVEPAADKLERAVDRPYFGGDPFVLVGKRITFRAEIDLIGAAAPGTAAPLSALLRICSHSETLTPSTSAVYAPISTGVASGTFDFYWAGIRFRMLGVRGSIDMTFNIREYAKASVQLTGLLVIPQDGEAPSGINWSAFQTPPAIETETWNCQVGGTAVHARQLSLNANATIPLIETSESRQVMVTDRKPAGSLQVVKNDLLSVWNPWALAEAQSVVTITNTITRAAGLNVAVPIRAQLEYPRPIDIEGVAGFEIPFTAVPSGAGGDEYSITYT